MKNTLVLSAVLLLLVSGCGGEGKISLNNGTGQRVESVTLTIAGASQSWTGIAPDETFTSRLEMPPGEVMCNLTWVINGVEEGFDFQTISRAQDAKKVSIFFSKDQLSVGYEF